jgi:hypothetical protein
VKTLALVALITLAGCTTVQYTPTSNQAPASGVRVLYEYPQDGKFKSLGTIDAQHYRPGLSAPTVEDAMPKLKAKAESVGGNALIVRSHQVGQFDRSISVTAEVLRIEGSE